MIFTYQDYRAFLKDTLVEKIKRNRQYSLRAMSQQIGLAPSTLSEVLQGKKRLSFESGQKVAYALKLGTHEREYLITLIQIESTKNETLKFDLIKKLESLKPKKRPSLDLDTFQAISEWYHIPIMELVQLPDYQASSQNIAKSLGISRAEADAAIDRLKRLGLITQDKKDRYRKNYERALFQSASANAGLRRFHISMLNKAVESIHKQLPSEKFVGSETLAFDSDYLDKANEIIEECMTRIVQLAQNTKKKNSVFHLGIQFFRLTERDKTK